MITSIGPDDRATVWFRIENRDPPAGPRLRESARLVAWS